MPSFPASPYRPPFGLSNGHLQTLVAARLRRVADVTYTRERITTPDADFLDLDWSRGGARRVVVISHGLEGNTSRSYVRGMVRAVRGAGWDALAWNFRSCSGEPNRHLYSYHSGSSDDLALVVDHALAAGYEQVALVGFSLGGNVTLKYLGERGAAVDPRLCAAVAVSVPTDLAAASAELARPANRLYMWYFLRSLHTKVRQKIALFPGQLDDADFDNVRTFRDFDDRYTAPLHGFRDAEDYWRQCSSKPLLPHITLPTLLLSATDDPFLPAACYPEDEARQSPGVQLVTPTRGGHVGFIDWGSGRYWSEQQALAFLQHTAPIRP